MGREPRVQVAGMYHVMTHAVANSWLFLNERDYQVRISILAEAVRKRRLRLHSFCLMGNHEHLLLSVRDRCLAAAMQRMNKQYASRFNRNHGRRGRVYWAPYTSVQILSARQLFAVARYIALNPELTDSAAHGFGRAETYRYSSYPGLIGEGPAYPFVDPSPILDLFGGGDDAAARFRRFVDDGRILGRLRRDAAS
jgi:putative transposase